ncbi:MAG: hypothetical protein Q4D81_13550 [Eubacteriales bacterium]|nr:hypothetical protein [Eubacteriales bacterium]
MIKDSKRVKKHRKLRELLKSPEAVEICKKHGMDLTDKRIQMVSGWSARKLATLPAQG